MRTTLTVAVASLAGLLITAVPVVAHHSFAAEYDASKPIKLTGTVTKIEWTNPHCFFHIDVKNEQSSKIENWALETAYGPLPAAGLVMIPPAPARPDPTRRRSP